MSRSADLYALQQTDTEIDARQQRLAEVTAQLGETQALLDAQQRLATAQDTLANLRATQRDQDLELKTISGKKRFSEEKLYGGKIRNPKELTDLQEEIESLGRRKAGVEDELFETMLMVEEGESEKEAASAALATIERDWQSDQAALQVELGAIQERLAELAAIRQAQVEQIIPADLTSYEHIRPRKGGLAVAPLKEGECQGCMAGVSPTRAKDARRDERLAYCDTCGRILFSS